MVKKFAPWETNSVVGHRRNFFSQCVEFFCIEIMRIVKMLPRTGKIPGRRIAQSFPGAADLNQFRVWRSQSIPYFKGSWVSWKRDLFWVRFGGVG